MRRKEYMTDSAKAWRILLALDASRDSMAALEAAFDLAAALRGEICGLFIEDARLLAAGSLPFAREVASLSGSRRPIAAMDMERRLQAVGNQARNVIDETGRRRKVRSSFRVTRGDVPAEILSAAEDADLVALGKAGWSIGAIRKPGSTCRTILSESPVPVLVVEQGATLAAPILAVSDGTPAGRRAVEFAHELSRNLGWKVALFSVHGASTGEDVLNSIRHENPRFLILPSSLPLKQCASKLTCAVLVVP